MDSLVIDITTHLTTVLIGGAGGFGLFKFLTNRGEQQVSKDDALWNRILKRLDAVEQENQELRARYDELSHRYHQLAGQTNV